ncbi:MAG: biotin--[acetyl-CoA-carboxylase] ligase, partial [Chlamydiia bacterium]|nr:biotin--[acetyl-CoA-carboxylase] ligase [Chlamydiia bacterium]
MKFREIHLPSVDSTIGYAQAHKGDFDPDCLTLISADEQTAGKGTQGRSFYSPKGGLYLSFCSALPKGFSEPQFAAQILALATLEAVAALGLKPTLKWPNDLLLGGKKAAGFLALISDEEGHLLLINSVGLNVNSEEIMVDQPTTTLKAEIGSPLDCEKLKNDICTRY